MSAGENHSPPQPAWDQRELEKPRTRKKDSELTPEAFESLLASLDSDRDAAARTYERIRVALLAYFEHHGSLCPAEHADKTFDLAARSLREGKEIYISAPAGYFYGVARNVLREYRKQHRNRFVSIDAFEGAGARVAEPLMLFSRERDHSDHERRLDCLDKCLSLLPAQNRELMLQYYDGEKQVKIANRKGLAEQMRVSMPLLRVRALRLRKQLEECVENCLEFNGA